MFSFPQSFSEVIKNLAVVLPHYVLNKGNILMVWIWRNFWRSSSSKYVMLQHSFSITEGKNLSGLKIYLGMQVQVSEVEKSSIFRNYFPNKGGMLKSYAYVRTKVFQNKGSTRRGKGEKSYRCNATQQITWVKQKKIQICTPKVQRWLCSGKVSITSISYLFWVCNDM